jgi:hypothetical protein
VAGALQQLASVYLAAHTDASGNGRTEPERMAQACSLNPEELSHLMAQLTATGQLRAWRRCPYSADLYWTLRSAST